MKAQCSADVDVTENDQLIASQATAARDVVETRTGSNSKRNRVMLATTFDVYLDSFPCAWYIELPRVPVNYIESITYVDTAGETQTLSTSVYTLADAGRGRIELKYMQVWPSTRYQPNAVTIRFNGGEAVLFTAVAGTDLCTVYGRTFADGDRLQVLNSGGSLPGGLAVGTTYFVRDASGSTFKVSLTAGGSAIDITSAGDGLHFAGLDMTMFQTMRQAVKGLTSYWYKNREAVMVAPGIAKAELPMYIESLIAAARA